MEEKEVQTPLIKRVASIGVIVLTMAAIAVQLLYLNKQKIGGKIYFPDQDKSFSPDTGDLLINQSVLAFVV